MGESQALPCSPVIAQPPSTANKMYLVWKKIMSANLQAQTVQKYFLGGLQLSSSCGFDSASSPSVV